MSDKNTNSCPKTCNKTVTGYVFYHTSKILQTRKLERSIFSVLFLKTFRDVKFTVDGSAFQTYITLSTKKFCLMLAVHLGLNSSASVDISTTNTGENDLSTYVYVHPKILCSFQTVC